MPTPRAHLPSPPPGVPPGRRVMPPRARRTLHAAGGFVAWCLVVVGGGGQTTAQQPVGPQPKPWDAILVASFNIQVFGESKMAKAQVVEILARIVRRFDIVCIQEVRAKSDEIVPAFVRAVNADGSRYQHFIGPREGRTNSKEQYAFVFDSDRIELDPSSPTVFPDPSDRLHRPPLCARFRTRVIPEQMAFTFWLVATHTDPDEVPQELEALTDVFLGMQRARPDEDDVIMLGDLNAGPPEFKSFSRIPGVGWAIANTTTNTRRTKTYDNLVFAWPATAEYRGVSGVLDLQSTFGIPLETALEVSDHNPVWAAFHPCEVAPQGAIGPVAAQPQPLR